MSIPYDPCHFDRDSDWRETRSKTMAEHFEFEETIESKRMANRQCYVCGKKLNKDELEMCLGCYLNEMMSEDYR